MDWLSELSSRPEPPLAGVAAPSLRAFEEYCWSSGLHPRLTRYLREVRDLRALRGRVVLVRGPGSFPPGFIVQLSQMELDGLVQVEESGPGGR